MFNFLETNLPVNWQFFFNAPATSIALGIIDVHNQICFYLIIITILVFWLFFYSLYFSYFLKDSKIRQILILNDSVHYEHCTLLELLWTILPGGILIAIALPSLSILYSMDESYISDVTLKVIGRQWFWSYEYPDYLTNNSNLYICFDSNLLSSPVANSSTFNRLLDVDCCVVLPVRCKIKALITSSDVLHSWCLPSAGIKTDACPGRLNQVIFSILREGIYYGQCSELCGAGHGFMPIVVKACSLESYSLWLSSFSQEFNSKFL